MLGRRNGRSQVLDRDLSLDEGQRRIQRCYEPFHAAVDAAVAGHARANVLSNGTTASNIFVDLGSDDGRTLSRITELLLDEVPGLSRLKPRPHPW